MMLTPWRCGHAIVWDGTCSETIAPPPPPPRVSLATTSGGNVANELIITRRKFSLQEPSYIFIPLAIDTARVLGSEAKVFLQDLGRKIGEQLVVPDPNLS